MSEVTIERLQVEVGATSSTAAQSLEALRQKLTELKAACSGGAGLRSVVNSLKKINEAANGINAGNVEKLSALADALGKIQGIGKFSVSKKAADQLARLAQVSQIFKDADFSGFTKLSDALAPLASQLETIGQVAPGVSESLSDLAEQTERGATQAKKAGKSHINLFAAIAVGYKTVQRAARSIAGLIDKSNTYIENINLFNASLGKFAGKAQEYAEHVGDIMGIDPGAWMRNQGVFQTLATGFGVAADRAYIMSKNLTQLGYDLSSFFNIAVDGEGGAMQKLQAGLSGELEPLRRLGYDLSQARLKAVALSLGIDQTFNSMTQAQKAQLRYYAIMTQVTKAQGDMARTLDTPANQLRILKAQTEQAARALGNIFIPILNKILPYAIAAARAIRMIADAIAELVGFKLPEIDYSGLNTAVNATDDIDDSMSSALGSAKKMNELLADWDELNIIASESGGSGGGSGSSVNGEDWMWELPEYDFLGGLIESKVQSIMDTIRPGIEWIKDNFDEISSFAIGIGTAMLGWKIGSKFATSVAGAETLLNRVFGIVGSIATAAASIVLNVVFTGKYLETGNIGWLFGSLATDTVGALLVRRMITSVYGADGAALGTFFGGALFSINGGIKLVMATKEAETEGLTQEAIATAALGAAEIALGAGMISKAAFGKALATKAVVGGGVMLFADLMATFMLSNALAQIDGGKSPVAWFGSKLVEVLGYGAGGLIASKKLLHLGDSATWTLTGAAVTLVSLINLVTTLGSASREGWTDITFAKALAGAIGLGVGVGAILKGLGVVSGAVAAEIGVVAFVIGLVASLIIYLTAPKVGEGAKPQELDWGEVEATSEELREYVQNRFFDQTAILQISLLESKIKNLDSAKSTLNTHIATISSTIRAFQIRGELDETTLTKLETEITGENGLIDSLQAYLDASGEAVEISATIFNFQGDPESDEFWNGYLTTFDTSGNLINTVMTGIGEKISELITKGFKDGLSERETEWLTSLSNMAVRITQAISYGEATAKFLTGIDDMTNFTRDTFVDAAKQFSELKTELRKDIVTAYDDVYSRSRGYEAGLKESMAAELALNGESDTYKAMLEEYNKLVKYNQWLIENRQAEIDRVTESYSAQGTKAFSEAIMRLIGNNGQWQLLPDTKTTSQGKFGNRIGVAIANGSTDEQIEKAINDYLYQILVNSIGVKESDVVRGMVESGVFHYSDLFGDDFMMQVLEQAGIGNRWSDNGKKFVDVWRKMNAIDLAPDYSSLGDIMGSTNTTLEEMSTSVGTQLGSTNSELVSIKNKIPTAINIGGFRIPMAASGGSFDVGQMFVAREAGPELVGTIGHRTAVANNNQIEGGIASGVREANSEQNSLLAESNRYLRAIASKRFTLEPSTALARTVKRSEEMRVQSEGV